MLFWPPPVTTEAPHTLSDSIARKDRSPHRGQVELYLVLFAFLCASATCAMMSQGGLFHDDIAHYLAARYAWVHPILLVDVWARPAYTVLASPFAQFGLEAMRWLNVFVSLMACLVSYYLATSLRLREAWPAAAFTAVQPLFFQLSFGTLTEPLFGLLLAAATLFYLRNRFIASALCMSALPLARAEGALFAAAWFVLLLKERQMKAVLCLAMFPALWVAASFAISGDPLFILNSNPYLHVNAYPESAGADLATKLSHWSDYFVRWPDITGPVLLPLVSLALIVGIARRGAIIPVVAIAYFVVQTIIMMTGRLGFFSDFNESLYPRFFVSIAPLLGAIAAQAVDYIFVELPEAGSKGAAFVAVAVVQTFAFTWWYLQPLSRLGRLHIVVVWAVGAMAVAAVVSKRRLTALTSTTWIVVTLAVGVSYLARWTAPYHLYPSDRLCIAAAKWLTTSPLRDRPLIVLHPSFWLGSERDPFDKSGLEAFQLAGGDDNLRASIRSVPDGAVIAWDSLFFVKHARLPLESLDPNIFHTVDTASTSGNPADPFYRDGENPFTFVLLEKAADHDRLDAGEEGPGAQR